MVFELGFLLTLLVYCSIVYEMNIKRKIGKIEVKKKKIINNNRKIRRTVRVYDYGSAYFGEPSKSQIEALPFKVIRIETIRRDYRSFSFVRCNLGGLFVILVVNFEADGVNRSSCQLMKKWDNKSSFIYEK